jgi:hypothetical protein
MSMRTLASRILLTALLALGFVAPVGAAELAIGSGTTGAGASTTIDLVLSLQPSEDVSALSLELSYDAGLLEEPPVCSIHPSISSNPVAKNLVQTQPAVGVARLGIFGFNNEVIPAGTVASCDFTAKATAPATATPLLGIAGGSAPNGASVAVSAASGAITIMGDGDGIDVHAGLPACTPGQTVGCSDNCPIVANPGQEDGDADGVGDACDLCTEEPDPTQANTDGDAFGNACDCDFDQDGSCGINDFNIFLGDFSDTTDGGTGTDMNADGSVGILDFQLFVEGFGAAEPGPSAP